MEEMEGMIFSDIGRNPLLQPDKIDRVLTYFPRNPNTYELAELMPLVNVPTDKVEMDYAKAFAGGMTPMVSTGSSSPIHGGYAMGEREFEAAEFREKVLLTEPDLVKLRRLGSKTEIETAENLLRKKFRVVEERLLNRLESMRSQVIFEKLLNVERADGPNYTLAYEHPGYLEEVLAGINLWSDTANSDPLGDLQRWAQAFFCDSTFAIRDIRMPMKIWEFLQANAQFQAALQANLPDWNSSIMQIKNQIAVYLGLPNPEMVMTSRGRINYDTELTAVAGFGAVNLTMRTVQGLAAGDTILLRRVTDLYSEKFTVVSVLGNVVTVAGPGVLDATGFAVGDVVRYWKPVQPFDKVAIMGKFEGTINNIGTNGEIDAINTWGDMCSTLSRYADLGNPKPGVFTKLIDKTNDDPPRWENVIGIKALPRIDYVDGWFLATVL